MSSPGRRYHRDPKNNVYIQSGLGRSSARIAAKKHVVETPLVIPVRQSARVLARKATPSEKEIVRLNNILKTTVSKDQATISHLQNIIQHDAAAIHEQDENENEENVDEPDTMQDYQAAEDEREEHEEAQNEAARQHDQARRALERERTIRQIQELNDVERDIRNHNKNGPPIIPANFPISTENQILPSLTDAAEWQVATVGFLHNNSYNVSDLLLEARLKLMDPTEILLMAPAMSSFKAMMMYLITTLQTYYIGVGKCNNGIQFMLTVNGEGIRNGIQTQQVSWTLKALWASTPSQDDLTVMSKVY